jgi:hypothetical protein
VGVFRKFSNHQTTASALGYVVASLRDLKQHGIRSLQSCPFIDKEMRLR